LKIIVSNDDGYQSTGLNSLTTALTEAGHDVVIFAPAGEQSAQAMAITLRTPVCVEQINKQVYAVHGTPVDSVNLALTSGLIEDADLLISGINNGRNLGDDTLYSGTVGAALEARHMRLPSIASSLAAENPKHYESAAKVIVKVLENYSTFEKGVVDVLNINIPDLPYEEMQGFEITQLSSRELSLPPAVEHKTSKVSEYRIGKVGAFKLDVEVAPSESTLRYDYESIEDGYVSITPLKAQLCQPMLDKSFIEGLDL